MTFPKGYKPPKDYKPPREIVPWRERKLRCKLDFHSPPAGYGGFAPFSCELCGTWVDGSGGPGHD